MRPGGRSPALIFLLLALTVTAARLCHSRVLWADDTLPLAAAIEVARGKVLYRDVWFDKPALVAWIDLLWGARAGVLSAPRRIRLCDRRRPDRVAIRAHQVDRTRRTLRGLLRRIFSHLRLALRRNPSRLRHAADPSASSPPSTSPGAAEPSSAEPPPASACYVARKRSSYGPPAWSGSGAQRA